MHSDRNPSFALHSENGKWICFSGTECGSGGLPLLVSKIMGLNDIEAHQWLLSLSEPEDIDLSLLFNNETERPKAVEILDDDWLIYDKLPEWFKERGFDLDDMHKFNMATECETNGLIIPCGEGFIRRYPPGHSMRYQYSVGFDRKSELFGFDYLLKRNLPIDYLLVTEGSLDAVWAIKAGLDCVAILGSSISDEQIRKISQLNPGELVLAFDNDEGGLKATKQTIKKMEHKITTSILQLPIGKKDLQECTFLQLRHAFNYRQSVAIALINQFSRSS